MKPLDLSGQRYGSLVGISRAAIKNKRTYWNCRCDCGSDCVVDAGHLRSGHTTSCGCVRRATIGNLKHGQSKSLEYLIWNGMRQRCSNPKNSHFRYYGGRGIRVCDQWQASFENFIADMGAKPSPKHTIDRINNEGNYEPGNCRWATYSQQNKNRRPRKGKVHGQII